MTHYCLSLAQLQGIIAGLSHYTELSIPPNPLLLPILYLFTGLDGQYFIHNHPSDLPGRMQQKLQFRGAVFTLDQHRLPCQELNNSITFFLFFIFLPKSKPLRNISSACWMWHHCAGMFPGLLSSTSVGAWVSLQVVSASCWVGQTPWL